MSARDLVMAAAGGSAASGWAGYFENSSGRGGGQYGIAGTYGAGNIVIQGAIYRTDYSGFVPELIKVNAAGALLGSFAIYADSGSVRADSPKSRSLNTDGEYFAYGTSGSGSNGVIFSSYGWAKVPTLSYGNPIGQIGGVSYSNQTNELFVAGSDGLSNSTTAAIWVLSQYNGNLNSGFNFTRQVGSVYLNNTVAISADPSGGFVCAIAAYDSSTGADVIVLVKTNSSTSSVSWARKLFSPYLHTIGIVQISISYGKVFLLGNTRSSLNGDLHGFLMAFNLSSGSIEWQKRFYGNGHSSAEQVSFGGAGQDNIIVGYCDVDQYAHHFCFDQYGTERWKRRFAATAGGVYCPAGVSFGNNGVDYYSSGNLPGGSGRCFLSKMPSSGSGIASNGAYSYQASSVSIDSYAHVSVDLISPTINSGTTTTFNNTTCTVTATSGSITKSPL